MAANEWIEWAGGMCPVAQDAVVEMQFRDGGTSTGVAYDYDWNHDGEEYDIVAYRRMAK